MDIGFIYSQNDPKQKQARDFLRKYIKERGLLARIFERQSDVDSPTLIVNGQAFKDLRRKPRGDKRSMYPSPEDIAKVLDRHTWCV